jgi:hypothetical protein
MEMIFGTWNLRSLYRAGALGLMTSEIEKYRMDLVCTKLFFGHMGAGYLQPS